ncbi:MAG: LuxR family transcriptional regulator [Rhizomicrobium sp.]
MVVCLDDFFSRLNTTKTVQQTWGEVVSFQESLGFDRMMYGYTAVSADKSDIDVTTLSTFPDAYNERYRQMRYHRADPVVRYCIESLSPCLVGLQALNLWPGCGCTSSQRLIVEEAALYGMKVGVAIPLRSPGKNSIAGMSLSNAMELAEFQSFIAEWGAVAQLAVVYAHTRIQMQLETQAAGGALACAALSRRERECLLWTAHGMSSKAVALRINLSPRTVDFHIANAMSKLGASTRSQAVAHAIAFGLLMP